jgi:uncharacterized protein (DUF2062 family)
MNKVKEKIIAFLKQGLTPRDLALTIALGAVLGTFPVIGSTSLLCTAASLALRLNLPAIQSVNWAVSPLQLALLIPLFNLGSSVFGGAGVTLSLPELIGRMRTDLLATVAEFLWITVQAIGVWSMAAPVAALTMFLITFPLITRLHVQYVRMSTGANIDLK